MAIYVPPSTRRRRLVLLVLVGLVVGVALGFAIGRSTSSGIDEALDSVRDQATEAAVALQRIPIEYEQAAAGEGGESPRTITEAIDRARAAVDGAFADAEWFGPSARTPVDDALDGVSRAADAEVPRAEFEQAVAAAVAAIEATFDVRVAGAG